MRTIEAANGKWAGVLTSLGIDAKCLDGHHHECPATGQGEDRFRFANRNGTGNYFCACSNGKEGGIGLLKCVHNWDFKKAASEVDRVVGNIEAEKVAEKAGPDPVVRLRKIWDASTEAGAAVTSYLDKRNIRIVSKRIRQARVMYYDKGVPTREYDCMIAQVVDVAGRPASIHVTYLDGGSKADVQTQRKLLPPVRDWDGGAIRLWPATDTLGVAEGIETAHSAADMDAIPVWAVVSAGNMEKFVWPSNVKHLVIYADNDASFTGQKAAYTLAFRAKRAGLIVTVKIPPEPGTDWNDVARLG